MKELTRFHEKLVNAMVYDIFHSVSMHCEADLEKIHRVLGQLFFHEPDMEEMKKVNHPEILLALLIKFSVSPGRFREVLNHVNSMK